MQLDNIIESRLDNLVYRSGFVPNIRTGRQIVSHGFVRVNNAKCNISSRLINLKDVVEVKIDKYMFHLSQKPSWRSVENHKMNVLEEPKGEEKLIDFKIFSEFLSRYM